MSLSPTPPRPLDLASPGFRADAPARWAALRDEAPVIPIVLPGLGAAWLLTRYDDVEAGLKDDRLSKDPAAVGRGSPFAAQLGRITRMTPLRAFDRNMLDLDPPDHTRLRRLVTRAFTPRRVAELEGWVDALAERLLDEAVGRGAFDLVSAYALPIPVTVICRLLGVPDQDHAKIHAWSERMVSLTPTASALLAIPSLFGFVRYLRRLIAAKRREPDGALISALVHAGDDGDALTEDETLAMIVLLLIAGHETTVNLIANGTLALLEHPDALARLRADPELLDSAVEELLRFYPPVDVATERYAREDIALGGVTVPRGSLVYLAIGSANRDPRRFTAPDTLDLARPDNRHLSFGNGRHFCVGASLARLEGRIALRRLIALPELRLADAGPPQWKPSLNLRGLRALTVVTGGR